jgi:hypothetical protein
MYRLFLTFWLIVVTAVAYPLRVTDLYKAGDEANYSIEASGKIIGSQRGVCNGWKIEESDSLLEFAMETKSVFSRAGKSFDMTVTSEVGYRPEGRPRKYHYTLGLLNVKVDHSGDFNGTEYFGKSTRMGVTQPFSFKTPDWPVLFDNNFILQWEIALRPLRLKAVGDSARVLAMIPQQNQMVVLTLRALPDENINFAGQSVAVRVYKVDPANQLVYIDRSGRLLKAVDTIQKITITRVAEGQQVEIAKKSLITTITDRWPTYGLLFAFALGWILVFGYRQALRWEAAVLFIAGCTLYWLSLQLLVPMQTAYFSFALDPKSPSQSIYLVLLGSAFVFALIEQLSIFLPVLALSFLPADKHLKLALALGAACGAGFGLMQAANLTSFAPDGSVLVRADLLQKLFLVGISATSGALLGLLLAAKLPWGYFLIPIGIKALFNWFAAFVQKGAVGTGFYTFISIVLTAGTLVAIYLIFRQRSSGRSLFAQNRGR